MLVRLEYRAVVGTRSPARMAIVTVQNGRYWWVMTTRVIEEQKNGNELSSASQPTFHYLVNGGFFAGNRTPEFPLPGFHELPDHAGLRNADCLIVHLPSILATNDAGELFKLHEMRRPNQVWVCESLESAVNYPEMDDQDFMGLFDVEISYRQSADIWTPYFPATWTSEHVHETPKRRRKFCSAFMSSRWDASERQSLLEELAQCMEVHSYGRILRNRKLWFDRGERSKIRALRQYRYTLAFENSVAVDYVTEKFYQPLSTGTIPVYLGAPNISEFAPGERCYVDVRDFSSAQDLAAFLRQADPSQFHAWRNKPPQKIFADKLARLKPDWRIRLGQHLKPMVTERTKAKGHQASG